ncbi:MAG: hypothetical protein Q9227_007171 [Pyrenula ochraceoflavens]
MDACKPRERVISILNDNDCPSFAIRTRHSPSPVQKKVRPTLPRQHHYSRTSSNSSSSSSPTTPPLLRLDSTSSQSTMDSPSPATPLYYNDPMNPTPYDAFVRNEVNPYLPSPTGITPLMDASNMLGMPTTADQTIYPFTAQPPKQPIYSALPTAVEISAAPVVPPNPPSLPQESSSDPSVSSSSGLPPPKKNKYPCPYAQSHNCLATFTTSGHAARHGKKHTGEKGVHCPVCNKAFTRKDNMKQHERTHKGSSVSVSSDDSKKSKAMITKEAQANRSKRADSVKSRQTSVHSPLSEVASLDINQVTMDSAVPSLSEPQLYQEPAASNTETSYPPLEEEATLAQINKRPIPSYPRTFSDLDTLAMAAAFDPYGHQQQQQPLP